jgi:uncharacterized protein (DUF58 family)
VTITPDLRLLRLLALWIVAALVTLLWSGIWPVLAGGAVLLGALVVLDFAAWRGEAPLALRRQIPERAHVGCEARLQIVLENASRRSVHAHLFEAAPPDLRASQLEFADTVVPAQGRTVVDCTILPSTRGDRFLGQAVALQRSPLGLFRRRIIGGAGDRLRVYPDTTRFLRPEALDPKRVLAVLGVRPSRRRGEGMEFESLREYVPGDDSRRLDWAASARRGRPVVRLYQHERNHTVVIALDASRRMATRIDARTKLDHAVDASLALAYAALLSRDRVAMTVFDGEVRGDLAPRAHRREFGQFVELLRPVQPRLMEADFHALVRSLTLRQRQRALVVVITDFVEADAATLIRPLAALGRRHRVLLVAVRDPLFAELDGTGTGGYAGAYRRIVLDDLLREREGALMGLRRLGVQTLDLPPTQLTAPVLNRYLELRYGPER